MVKKITIFVFIFIILSVAAFGGYYFYTQRKQNLLEVTQQQILSDFDNNNLDSSIAKNKELLKSYPKNIDNLLLLATSYTQKGSLEFKEKEYGDLAIQTANEVLAIDSNNSEAYRIIGYAYEIEQNYPEALKNYDKSISLDARNALALATRGHAFYLMGETKKAADDFNAALAIDPHVNIALLNLARMSYETQDNKKAEEYLSKVSDSDSSVSLLSDKYVLSALIREAAFDMEGALNFFSKALELNPKSPYIITNLASVKMIMLLSSGKVINANDIKKLITDVEAAIAINPNQTISYLTLGRMKIFLGDSNGAQEEFKKAKEIITKDITLSSSQKDYMSTDIDALLDTKIIKTN